MGQNLERHKTESSATGDHFLMETVSLFSYQVVSYCLLTVRGQHIDNRTDWMPLVSVSSAGLQFRPQFSVAQVHTGGLSTL